MPDAEVRARHLKSTLAAVDAGAAAAEIRRAAPLDVLARIERAHGQDWLSVLDDVRLVRVVHAALGPAAYHRFAQGVVLSALDGPLLGPLFRAAVATFGRDPGSWIRWIPKAWTLVYRGCGAWTVERLGPHAFALAIARLPPACLDEPMWPTSLASSLSAVLAATGADGASELVGLDRAGAEARYRITWTPRGS
jgi:hypothetical protein